MKNRIIQKSLISKMILLIQYGKWRTEIKLVQHREQY
jgi:hypothetical protein